MQDCLGLIKFPLQTQVFSKYLDHSCRSVALDKPLVLLQRANIVWSMVCDSDVHACVGLCTNAPLGPGKALIWPKGGIGHT